MIKNALKLAIGHTSWPYFLKKRNGEFSHKNQLKSSIPRVLSNICVNVATKAARKVYFEFSGLKMSFCR